MLAMYGKARVGQAVIALASALNLPIASFDDADAFNPLDFEAIIPSPGIPPSNRAYSGGNVIGELDFSARYLPPGFKIIAVTGTDGKSTTAWIVYKMLCAEFGEHAVFLSGNFEIPLAETVLEIRNRGLKRGYIVVEVSSFMGHTLGLNDHLKKLPPGYREGFEADITIFTNFERDHLDWHDGLAGYFGDKMRLIHRTKKKVLANEKLKERSRELNCSFPANTRWFGLTPELKDRTDGEHIVISGRQKYLLSETQFKGMHNAYNILAAGLVGNELGICSKRIRASLGQIQGLPHRLELVTQKNWIQFIDDSKSTSAQSLKAALESFSKRNVLLIAGGHNKGDSFDHLASNLSQTCKAIICIGATGPLFASIAKAAGIPSAEASTMQEAVQKAYSLAESGDVILLSPGCASFWLFKNYLDRAHQFIESVHSIPESHV